MSISIGGLSTGAGLGTSQEGGPSTWSGVAQGAVAVGQSDVQWKQILSIAMAAYGLVKQSEINERAVAVTENASALSGQYYTMARDNYDNVIMPGVLRLRALFDESLSCFKALQCEYLHEAMRLKEYTPDFTLAAGRARASVMAQFDRAQRSRARAIGPYASGRCCDDATRFAIARAQATTAAINNAYRAEDAKKIKLDAWYFDRWTAGAKFMTDWRSHIISALTGAATASNAGLTAIGGAVSGGNTAAANSASALGQSGQFYGNISRLGIGMAGFDAGYNGPQGGGGSSSLSGFAGDALGEPMLLNGRTSISSNSGFTGSVGEVY